MNVVNLIIVVDHTKEHVLMCHRQKDPYKGLYNFVGGKKDMHESNQEGAYRELFEESGIAKEDIKIQPLYFTQYFEENLELQVYYGFLKQELKLVEEINPLRWISLDEDFSNKEKFAGDGNIDHMITILKDWCKL